MSAVGSGECIDEFAPLVGTRCRRGTEAAGPNRDDVRLIENGAAHGQNEVLALSFDDHASRLQADGTRSAHLACVARDVGTAEPLYQGETIFEGGGERGRLQDRGEHG
jgi:hypothetical protein